MEGLHTRRWLAALVARGHDVHAVSFYAPRAAPEGVVLNVLKPGPARSTPQEGMRPGRRWPQRILPTGLQRLAQAWRYRRAGLRRCLDAIRPDLFQAHYVVEHGFFGALAGFHPFVVSAWGSDLLVAPRSPLGRAIARYTLRRADLITANDPSLARRAVELGAAADDVHTVRLGIDEVFFVPPASGPSAGAPVIISTRALESLYNVDSVLRAVATLPDARLVVANTGSRLSHLQALARELGLTPRVRFIGHVEPAALRDELAAAAVYVSVPASDSFPLSTLEAMAAGCFPVVSDLPSQDGMIEDGVNGLRVPAGNVAALAAALSRALSDPALRKSARAANRALAEAEGRRDRNILALERHFYRLAGHPVGGAETI